MEKILSDERTEVKKIDLFLSKKNHSEASNLEV